MFWLGIAALLVRFSADGELCLLPVLCPVVDMEYFDGFRLHCINDDVGKRRKRQFSCAAAMAGPAPVRGGSEGTDTLIDCPDSGLRKLRVVPLKIGFDAF